MKFQESQRVLREQQARRERGAYLADRDAARAVTEAELLETAEVNLYRARHAGLPESKSAYAAVSLAASMLIVARRETHKLEIL